MERVGIEVGGLPALPGRITYGRMACRIFEEVQDSLKGITSFNYLSPHSQPPLCKHQLPYSQALQELKVGRVECLRIR